MTTTRPQHKQHQWLLALLLFLVGQLALALHSHDLSLHLTDTEDCVVCLVSNSGNPAPHADVPSLHFQPASSHYLPVPNRLVFEPQPTTAQPRAPPIS